MTGQDERYPFEDDEAREAEAIVRRVIVIAPRQLESLLDDPPVLRAMLLDLCGPLGLLIVKPEASSD